VRNTQLPESDCDQVLECSFDVVNPEDQRVNLLGTALVPQEGDPPGVEVAVVWEGCSSLVQSGTALGDPNLFSFTTINLNSSIAINSGDILFTPEEPQNCDTVFGEGDEKPEVLIQATIDGLPDHCGCSAVFTPDGNQVE
jgi:hypothetical protein